MSTKQSARIEVNRFVQGLITEASPLDFPQNATIDEENFTLSSNGKRERRRGMDFENDYILRPSGIASADISSSSINSFNWENAGGVSENEFIVIQFGNKVLFYDANSDSLSSDGYKGEFLIDTPSDSKFSFASVNGFLVVATSEEALTIIEYRDEGFYSSSERLLIRDLFGVEDVYTTDLVATIPVGALEQPIVFNRSTQSITCADSDFDSFTVLSAGDYVIFKGTKSNNKTFLVNSYDSGSNTLYVQSGVIDEVDKQGVYSEEYIVYVDQFDSHVEEVGTRDVTYNEAAKVSVSIYGSSNTTRDLLDDEYLNYRPAGITNTHTYNLSNQSWAIPRRTETSSLTDPITDYYTVKSKFPSNTDMVWNGLSYEAGNSAASINTSPKETFFPRLIDERNDGIAAAAKGFFIIDALRRGESRLAAFGENKNNYPQINSSVTSLPSDITPGGPSIITEYAGRVFYSGFSEEVLDGDNRSPTLSSYILFSKLVTITSDIFKCFQEGDPTSRESSDIIDTDGGFIRISGIKKVLAMETLDDALFIIADNGVWMVKGGSDDGFKATNYLTKRLSRYGATSGDSVVIDGSSLYYWADDGIYVITKDQYGDWVVKSLTDESIKSFYDNISPESKVSCKGIYDPFERKITWLFQFTSDIDNPVDVRELVFDIRLGAFYPIRVFPLDTNSPIIVGLVKTGAFTSNTTQEFVYSDSEPILVGSDAVYINQLISDNKLKSVKYITLKRVDSGDIYYSFSLYTNTSFKDWEKVDGVGKDAYAYIVTGATTGGDSSIHKQVPYLVMHFERTETGFELVNGEVTPENQSACLVSSMWDWSNTSNSNKWSPSFQAYRYRRGYIPEGLADPYDTGFELITTRNKIRGRGRAFSFRMETQPEKDCRILGWSLSVNGNRVT